MHGFVFIKNNKIVSFLYYSAKYNYDNKMFTLKIKKLNTIIIKEKEGTKKTPTIMFAI